MFVVIFSIAVWFNWNFQDVDNRLPYKPSADLKIKIEREDGWSDPESDVDPGAMQYEIEDDIPFDIDLEMKQEPKEEPEAGGAEPFSQDGILLLFGYPCGLEFPNRPCFFIHCCCCVLSPGFQVSVQEPRTRPKIGETEPNARYIRLSCTCLIAWYSWTVSFQTSSLPCRSKSRDSSVRQMVGMMRFSCPLLYLNFCLRRCVSVFSIILIFGREIRDFELTTISTQKIFGFPPP